MAKGRHKMLLGLIIGACFLFLAFRRVDIAVLVQKLTGFNFWWLPLFIVSHLLSLALRSWRWQAIVNPIKPVGLGVLFPITVRGFLFSNLIPMKAGDLYRFSALSQRSGLTKTTSFATLVVERLADLAGLVLLSAMLSIVLPLPPAIRSAVIGTGVAGCGALTFWWSARRLPGLRERMKQKELQLAEWADGSPLGKVIDSLRQGLTILKDLRQWVILLGATGLIFVSYSIGIIVVLRGFDIKGISLLAPLALLAFVFWSSMLPQAPAGVGTFEYASALALQLFGVGREEGLAVALVLHAAVIVNLLVVSGLTLLIPSLPLDVSRPTVADTAVEGERPHS